MKLHLGLNCTVNITNDCLVTWGKFLEQRAKIINTSAQFIRVHNMHTLRFYNLVLHCYMKSN